MNDSYLYKEFNSEMPNTNDLLQAKLQKIYEALGGDAGITPPPDVKDTLGWWLDLISDQLADGTGGAVVPDDYFFADESARDMYFSAHPDELKDGVLCCTNSPVALWKYNGTEWKDSSSWVKGPKGDKGNNIEVQNDGTYIQWRVVGADTWNNLVALSTLRGADGQNGENGKDGSDGQNGADGKDGDSVYLQVTETYIQWKHTSDTNWQNLIALSLLKGTDGSDGADGISIVWKGTLSSPPENPQINWAYYNSVEGKSYIWDGLSWNIMTQDGLFSGVSEAPNDGKQYARQNLGWAETPVDDDVTIEIDEETGKRRIKPYSIGKDQVQEGGIADINIHEIEVSDSDPNPSLLDVGPRSVRNWFQDLRNNLKFIFQGLPTSQERKYLDDLMSTGALDRIYWSVIITTTQVGSITTDRVYLNITPDVLTTASNWSITHNDGSVLERDGKQITYTKNGTVEILSDGDGNVLEHKFHIPTGITVTAFDGNPSDDINNVYISVEFDIRSLHEVIGDTDSLTTTEKVVVKAINEIWERLSKIDAADRFINFDSNTGWNVGLTNDTHGGHIRLLDKTGASFLDVDVAVYGSGLEAVFSITFIGGEFSPASSYAQGDRAHHRKAVTLTGWPEVTECTLAYIAKDTISPGPWNESEWDLRDDAIAGTQINTYAQIARDGFIFVASHQMTWDHEPTLDEFVQDDWYLINRLPVIPGKFVIFMLDNSTGQVGWLAVDELAPFTGTNTVDIDAQGNVSLILNTGGILERTSTGLLLKWYVNDGVYTLGSDGNTKFYDKSAIDTKLNEKQNIPTTQSANTIFAGPSSGNAAIPTYRKLVAADIPNLNVSKLEGVLAKAQGGTGNANGTADTLTTARKISITGAAVGNANFDGSGDITISTTAPASGSGLLKLSGFKATTIKITNFFNGYKKMFAKVIVQQSDWGGNGEYAEILFTAGDNGATPAGKLIFGSPGGMTFWRDGLDFYATYTRGGEGGWNAIFVFAAKAITMEQGATKPDSATQISIA
jgi:hypothetical protein